MHRPSPVHWSTPLKWNGSLLVELVERTQAAGTQIQMAPLPFHYNPVLVNVGLELPICGALGMANVMTELGSLATHLTFCHFHHLTKKIEQGPLKRAFRAGR
jgi:hypothetical protein